MCVREAAVVLTVQATQQLPVGCAALLDVHVVAACSELCSAVGMSVGWEEDGGVGVTGPAARE